MVGSAQAAPVTWYAGIEGGWSGIADNDLLYIGTIPATITLIATGPAEAQFDTGWALLATLGMDMGGGWRSEGELGYRTNDLTLAIPFSGSTEMKQGSLVEISLMMNWLLDVPLTNSLKLSVGGGMGGEYAELKTDFGFEGSEWSFALQGILGMSFALDQQTDLTMNYRYLLVDAPEFKDDVGPVISKADFDDIGKHALTIGLRHDL
jgi:OOP family OmpA-OmpF porin